MPNAAEFASWPWWAIAAPSLLAGALLALWAGRRQARLADELREAREALRRLEALLDHWRWRADAQGQVEQLQPPHGHALARPASGGLLWERLRTDEPDALRARIERHEALLDLEVHFTPAPGMPPRRALLRGVARADARGAFAGYEGLLRELPEPPPAVAAAGDAGDAEQASFGYTVSHDLRAPIRVVEGFTKILKEDYGRALDRIGNDHLDRVLGAAARMNSMIDALLALSRLTSQPLVRQPVNLSQLAGYVAEDLRRQTPGREVALHIEPGLQVSGDPTLLRIVLENLLGNAWKYTGKSRAPEVWLQRHPQRSDTYTVRDNGAGFDMRFADRLFGVFQRLHSASDFQGTGIGLATVRRIVRRHGGEVWAEAEVDRGAAFHFTLPTP